jgi:hypothetical protein
MANPTLLPCDGCGQLADSAHISRRLQRLAWATRFRPVHIHALLLAGVAPALDSDFLYAPVPGFQGEAAGILRAVQIPTEGKSPESVLGEFQKLGLMLVYILECPLQGGTSASQALALLEHQLPATLTRIRRSLKPKRLLLISSELNHVADKLHQSDVGCPILPVSPGAFLSTATPEEAELQAFRGALAVSNAQTS